MAKLKIVTDPEFLRKPSKAVVDFDARLHTLLNDMRETLDALNGVGLAAPQVSVLLRVVLVKNGRGGNETIELINPQIISQTDFRDGEELCFSIVPMIPTIVNRAQKVTVAAQDRYGKPFTMEFRKLSAVCAAHEIDHLNGILMTDRVGKAGASS